MGGRPAAGSVSGSEGGIFEASVGREDGADELVVPEKMVEVSEDL